MARGRDRSSRSVGQERSRPRALCLRRADGMPCPRDSSPVGCAPDIRDSPYVLPSPARILRSFVRNPLSLLRVPWTRGLCNVCGYRGPFVVRWTHRHNPRETLGCPRCGSISRDRVLAHLMSTELGFPPVMQDWPSSPDLRILEPSPRRGRAAVLARKVALLGVEYPEVSIERLPFDDGFFDHVICADVFEHVRDDEAGFHEIHRVLRKAGSLFLQVPYRMDGPTFARVELADGGDRHLLPPEYHGERSLTYRLYGNDLAPRLERMGFSVFLFDRPLPGLAVPSQVAFVCKKPVLDSSPGQDARSSRD